MHSNWHSLTQIRHLRIQLSLVFPLANQVSINVKERQLRAAATTIPSNRNTTSSPNQALHLSQRHPTRRLTRKRTAVDQMIVASRRVLLIKRTAFPLFPHRRSQAKAAQQQRLPRRHPTRIASSKCSIRSSASNSSSRSLRRRIKRHQLLRRQQE